MLEHDIPRIDGLEICRAIRSELVADESKLPIVLVAAREDPVAGGWRESPIGLLSLLRAATRELRYVLGSYEPHASG